MASAAQTGRMARPARESFGLFIPIQTRWLDNDIYGHVNNSVYGHYIDTAINDWLAQNQIVDVHAATGLIGLVVETRCHFFDSVAFPDRLEAGLRITQLGRSSVTFEVGCFGQGRRLLRRSASACTSTSTERRGVRRRCRRRSAPVSPTC